MDRISLNALVALLDAEQIEDGTGLDITPARYLEIAGGAALTSAEAEIILASPLARDLLRLAPALLDTPAIPVVAPPAKVVLSPRLLAARGAAPPAATSATPFEVDLRPPEGGPAWGSIKAVPGIGGAMAWLLTLRLDPGQWLGGVVDGFTIELREPGEAGQLWLAGTTNGFGEIRAVWAAERGAPQHRWEALGDQRLIIRFA